MYEYNILACQVSSKPLGVTDLKTESGINTQHINIAEDKHFHKNNELVSLRFEKN